MATFSLGVIGCGAATKRYYVPALKKFKNIIDNIYFVDNNYDRAKDVFEEVGIGEICTDYREILGKIEGAVNTALKGIPGSPRVSIPRFASGIENFRGGLAYVHQGEVLANLPKGTNVIPSGMWIR